MSDGWMIVALPLAAAAIVGFSVVWWTVSWTVEGYRLARALIHSAN